MREFEVNEFITLKLENDTTFIYLKGEKFKQCKKLLFQIHELEKNTYNKVKSIDEFEKILRPQVRRNIPPEVEFWGHCSNLQVWVEHDYDTRLLHRNLAFPLLKKLAEIGDLKAKKAFKEEIAIRFSSAFPTVISYLVSEGYLDFMNAEELELLIESLFTVRFIYALQELVRGFYPKLRKYIKTQNFEKLLLNFYEGVSSKDNPDLSMISWDIIQDIISIELHKQFPVDKDKYILWFEEQDGIKSIKTLNLSNRKNKPKMEIKEVFGLKFLGGLKDLKLNNFKITDFSCFKNSVELKELIINHCEIKSIRGIEKLKELKTIRLNSCLFPRIYDFGNLQELNELKLVNCAINEIMGLEQLNNLETLDLAHNQIKNIKGIKTLRKLNKLILDHNKIQKIDGLENLSELIELNLSSNNISRIENLDGLKKLLILHLSFNNIVEIENLENLIKLERLYLGYNQIKDDAYLEKLKSIKFVSLKGNNLSFKN